MQLRIVVAYLVHTKDIAYVVKKPCRGFFLPFMIRYVITV